MASYATVSQGSAQRKRKSEGEECAPSPKRMRGSMFAPCGPLDPPKGVPFGTMQHFAAYLAPRARRGSGDGQKLLNAIRQDNYLRSRSRKRHQLTDFVLRTPGAPAKKSALQQLPVELLNMVNQHLEPADSISLGQTCKDLFAKIDYRLIDVVNMRSSYEVRELVMDYGLRQIINEQYIAVTDRLKRDALEDARMVELVLNPEMPDNWRLACSVCHKLHPLHWFDEEEQSRDYRARRCRAAKLELRLCDHYSEDFVSLRALRGKGAVSYAMGAAVKICEHLDYGADSNSVKNVRVDAIGGAIVSAKQSITLIERKATHHIPDETIKADLQKRETPLCPHIKTSDHAVFGSVRRKPIPYLPHEEEFTKGRCKDCGMGWQVEVIKSSTGGFVLMAAQIKVVREFKELKDCWSDEYLKQFDGGLALKEQVMAATIECLHL